MNILVLWERNLCSVETHGDSAFISVEGATVGPCSDGALASEVCVRILRNEGRVLDVGVTEGRDFVPGLHGVGEGVVVVVDVIR